MFLSLLHSTCTAFSGDTPVADGPRHCGQFSAPRIGAKSTRIAVENRIVITGIPLGLRYCKRSVCVRVRHSRVPFGYPVVGQFELSSSPTITCNAAAAELVLDFLGRAIRSCSAMLLRRLDSS